MAKREADTQLTKGGGLSEDDGFSVGAQVGGGQRATAAQMAARRLAKPRGGRRPGTPSQARYPNAPTSGFNQTQPSLFQPNSSNNTSVTQQQQGGLGSSDGAQPNQISQSFPPFNAGSNTGFDTQFTAPSGGFSFSAGQTDSVNNPFANTPPPDTGGFAGSIFKLPAQKDMTSYQKFCEGAQPPLFAAHSPFHNGNQNTPTPDQSQPSTNPFDFAAGQQQQQQTNQQGSSLFSQQQQQEAPGNMFAPQQPSPTMKDLFGPSKQPQSQAPSTPFSQGNSIFQQPDSAQPTSNPGQGSTSSAPEDYSMMSTSPDTSPQTTPSGGPNGSNAQPQSSPTKDATVPAAGLSFFDKISSPTTQPSVQPSPSPSKNTSAPGPGGSIFDSISKPTTEASAALPSNANEKAASLEGGTSIFDRITRPTSEANAQTPDSGNMFKIQQVSDASNHLSASSGDPQPAKKKLFGHSLAPQAAQPPSTSQSSMYSLVKSTDISQPASNPVQGASNVSVSPLGTQNANGQAAASRKRKLGAPPDPLEGCTEEERIQIVTGWRLKLHDAGMQKRLRTNSSENEKALLMKFYRIREQEIKAAEGGPLPGPTPGSKRKAAEEQHADEAQGKKTKFANPSQDFQGTLSNGTKPTSSQTSSIFKNILESSKGQESMVNGTGGTKPASARSNEIQYPSLPSSSRENSKPSLFQPKPSSTSSIPPPADSARKGHSQGLAFPGTPYQPPSSSLFAPKTTNDGASAKPPTVGPGTSTPLGGSGLFGFKPTSSSGPSSDATKPSAFKVPAFGGSASSTQGNSNKFSATPQTSSEPSADATKEALASKAPNFGASTASPFGTSNSFSIKPASSSEAPSDASKPSSFKVPTFGAGTAPNFLGQFGKAAEKTAEEAKQKRKAEDYDSDQEDEATWERKYEEEQRAKKQKLEEIRRNKTAKQVNGKWQLVATSGDESASTNTPNRKPTGSPISVFDQPRVPLTNGHNIFGHLSGEESGAEGSKTGDADDEDDGQDEGHDEEDEAENGDGQGIQEEGNDAREQKASSNPFGARLSRAASPQGNAAGSSMFDRISKDGNGNPVRQVSNPGEKAASEKFDNNGKNNGARFGSSAFSTSNSFGKAARGASDSTSDMPSSPSGTNIFGQPSTSSTAATAKTGQSPNGDHTWKADSPIKFGSQSNPPAVNVTAPSPSKPSFGGLFGASKTNATVESPPKSASSLFSASPTKAPATGFGFGFTPANVLSPGDTAKPVESATKSTAPSYGASTPKPLFAMPSTTASTAKPATGLFALPPNNAFSAKPTTHFFASPSNAASPANPTVRSLAPPSNTGSGATSRATSPGATTGESASESAADNDDGALPKDDQVDLMSARPGEENEDVLFEVKAKAMTYDPASEGDSKWTVKGVGPLRVMKHRITGNTRLLLRAEPSGRIAVNAGLLKGMTYESTSAKAIRVPIANETGKIDVYTFKVGKDDDAKELAGILSANRPR